MKKQIIWIFAFGFKWLADATKQILDCYFGGAALFITHTIYFISYKCGVYMTILCALDKYFFTGSVTKFIYVTLFMCNIWWCKKYALTNRCRGCWVNTKQMLSLPCKCLIYCHDRCSRRMNSCLWCFTKIGELIYKVHILWEGHINSKKKY